MKKAVQILGTDVSEERIVSIFRVKKSASREHTRCTRRKIPDDGILLSLTFTSNHT
jgi:hypothetical protein